MYVVASFILYENLKKEGLSKNGSKSKNGQKSKKPKTKHNSKTRPNSKNENLVETISITESTVIETKEPSYIEVYYVHQSIVTSSLIPR